MSVLEIKNLSHRFDDRLLFDRANLTVNNGEHIGIVGLNGAGKSTFINILDKRISQDEGEVNYLSGIRRGYLDQHAALDNSMTVMEYLSGAFDYLYEKSFLLDEIYEKMDTAEGEELDRLIKKSTKMSEELVEEGFYDLEAKIKKVANGLGVNKFGYNTVIATLSGGERAKLMLAKLLLSELDIMLLDEPTNFGNYTPANMDNIKTRNGAAVYYQGKGWRGSLRTLVPGQGFIYKSKASTNTQLTFPSGKK